MENTGAYRRRLSKLAIFEVADENAEQLPTYASPIPNQSVSATSPVPGDLSSSPSETSLLPAIPPEVRKLLLSMSFLNVEADPTYIIDDISKVLHMRMFSKGDFVMRQGEISKAVFFIVKGTIEVINNDGEITFAELSSGSYVGEIGIMFNMKRTASVVAKTNCTLLVMTGDDLRSVLKKYPEAERSMQKAAHQRITDLAREYDKSGRPMTPELIEQLNAMNYQFENRGSFTNSGLQSLLSDSPLPSSPNQPTPNESAVPSESSSQASDSEEEYEEVPMMKPTSIAMNLHARITEKRRASVAVWSDDKLLNFAAKVVGTKSREARVIDVIAQSQSQIMNNTAILEEDSMEKIDATFHGMPDFILARIIRHLDLLSRTRVAQSSKLLQAVLKNHTHRLFSVVDFSPWNKNITNNNINSLLGKYGSGIQKLSLKNCWAVTNAGIDNISKNCPSVTSLDLSSVWELTDGGLFSISKGCADFLVSINLSNCRKISDEGIVALCENAELLQFINVDYCKKLTSKSLKHIRWGQISEMSIQRCTGIRDDGFISWVGEQRQEEKPHFDLEEANLADCSFLTSNSIKSLSELCPKLKYLNLSFCCSLKEDFAEYLVQGCPFIHTLDISFCGMAISDKSITTLAQGLPNLKNLNVKGCVQLTDLAIENLASHALKLETITYTQCQKITPGIADMLDVKWTEYSRSRIMTKAH